MNLPIYLVHSFDNSDRWRSINELATKKVRQLLRENKSDGIYHTEIEYLGERYSVRYVIDDHPASLGVSGKGVWINAITKI